MALALTPPIDPMLAQLESEIPSGDGWLYEPKWDGFRAIAFVNANDVTIASRDHKPLERYFPELVPALDAAFREPCVVDGEVIVTERPGWTSTRSCKRIHPAASPSSYSHSRLLRASSHSTSSRSSKKTFGRSRLWLGARS
jgi:hypothetical protein